VENVQLLRRLRISFGLLAFLGTGYAQALPIVTGSTSITEADGFPGVCAAPCFTATLDFEVWAPDDPGNPMALAGNNTYIYTLSHTGGTFPFPGIPLTRLGLSADSTLLSAAGFIAGTGIAPTAVAVDPFDGVNWTFPAGAACPACLEENQVSDRLFIQSPLAPGDIAGSLDSTILNANFTTTGPVSAASVPETTTLALFGLGLAGLRFSRRRKVQASRPCVSPLRRAELLAPANSDN
jgi:hypothetical protein